MSNPITIRIVRDDGTERISEGALDSLSVTVRTLLERDYIQSVAIGYPDSTTIYQKQQ